MISYTFYALQWAFEGTLPTIKSCTKALKIHCYYFKESKKIFFNKSFKKHKSVNFKTNNHYQIYLSFHFQENLKSLL